MPVTPPFTAVTTTVCMVTTTTSDITVTTVTTTTSCDSLTTTTNTTPIITTTATPAVVNSNQHSYLPNNRHTHTVNNNNNNDNERIQQPISDICQKSDCYKGSNQGENYQTKGDSFPVNHQKSDNFSTNHHKSDYLTGNLKRDHFPTSQHQIENYPKKDSLVSNHIKSDHFSTNSHKSDSYRPNSDNFPGSHKGANSIEHLPVHNSVINHHHSHYPAVSREGPQTIHKSHSEVFRHHEATKQSPPNLLKRVPSTGIPPTPPLTKSQPVLSRTQSVSSLASSSVIREHKRTPPPPPAKTPRREEPREREAHQVLPPSLAVSKSFLGLQG